jgi:hypothetical protein
VTNAAKARELEQQVAIYLALPLDRRDRWIASMPAGLHARILTRARGPLHYPGDERDRIAFTRQKWATRRVELSAEYARPVRREVTPHAGHFTAARAAEMRARKLPRLEMKAS